MKKFFIILLLIFCIFSCETQKNPIKTRDAEQEYEFKDLVWKSTDFPLSSRGSSYVFNISVNSNNDIFASDNRGNLYRMLSEDTSWVLIKYIGLNHIPFIFVNLNDQIYIGSNSTIGSSGSSIYSSTDNGENWSTFYSTQNDCNNLLEINDTIYIARYGGIARSIDQGQNWELLNNILETTSVMDIVQNTHTGSLFIGTWNDGLFKSTDRGNTWDHIAFDDWAVIPILYFNEGIIFACTGTGLYRSTDDGNSWTQLTNGIPEADILSIISTPEKYILAGLRESGLFLSIDMGDTWQNIGFEGTEVLSLGIDSSDYVYVGTDSLGILKSNLQFKN